MRIKGEKGFSLVETTVAVCLLGIVSAIFLGSIGTAAKATMITDERVTAEILARNQIEYIKDYPYDYYASEYPVDPALDIPYGWSMENPTAEALHGTDDGIQKVTITIQCHGRTMLSTFIYKVDR